jgi:hypothetical protein
LKEAARSERPPLCPSAQPDWDGAVLIGVVSGTADQPIMTHLNAPPTVTEEILRLASPATPTEVFRFAAFCIGDNCRHFANSKCRLAAQVVRLLPEVAKALPKCAIRADCRWWRQEGKAACLCCPQIVTDNYNPSELMRRAATPAGRGDEP